MSKNDDQPGGAGRLGTFGGVLPNVLTILGVIMFLRTGWVVGNAGLWQALLILVIANCITILTALSLSAISTNTRVGAGGAYFLISRSLGLEVGGSIGVPLYFAQAISVAFYLVGFTESLQYMWPGIDQRLVGSAALIVFFVVAWFGAGIIARTQYVILVLLLAAIVSIFTGSAPIESPAGNLEPVYGEGQSFWTVFAIFFPAVTGIMAGVSMSGDLRNPSRSIPLGTIAAVLVTFVIYAALMGWLALNAERDALVGNNLILLEVASLPKIIFVGLWAATLSSALASLAAAPRTLQALGHDGVLPRLAARGLGRSREPHVALVITFVIAEACILVGSLDLIAPVISMFFLATYGTVNLVAGIERLVKNPSYRPTFHTHWLLSLAGGVGCVSVMFLIHPPATIVAAVVILTVYALITRARLDTAWGDMRSGLWFSLARFGLLRFIASRQHIRNWRPVFLVLTGNPKARSRMIEFANWFESRRGFLFLAQIVTGDRESLLPRQRKLKESLGAHFRENRLPAVANAVVADDLETGVETLLQTCGIGVFEPNTVMMGWSDDDVRAVEFALSVRRILQMERNLVVYAERDREGAAPLRPVIDVWWYARDNGSFMLTLAWLLTTNPRWRDHDVRVLRMIRDAAGVDEARAGTTEIVEAQRVRAQVEVIVSNEAPIEVIGRTSERSAVCFVGIAVGGNDEGENPLNAYAPLVEHLRGHVFLSKSWHDLRY